MTIMIAPKIAMLLMLALLPLGSGMAAEVNEAPEVIVVTGRQPGPPLWKVSNGDKVLWIFPYLNWIPQDMTWESGRVARVIAESQEFLDLPEWSWTPPKGVMLNPIYVARNLRNGQRRILNPDGGTLEENLPPELYARFAALQARYVPGNSGLVEMRPLIAGRTLISNIRKREGLVPGDDILKTIQRLVRRNRDIQRTEIAMRLELGDNFDEYAHLLEAVWESFPPEQEQACFEQQLLQMEEDINEMKIRANSWAQGYIDEFLYDEFSSVPLVFDESKACSDLFTGSSSPQREALAGMIARVNQVWLDAAENALARNASTFAVLPINELLAEDGVLSKLKAKGYDVREP
jgi:hypothetical protein